MGFSPAEVDRLSLWQLSAAWNGYVAAHSNQQGGAKLSATEVDELFAWIDSGPPETPASRLPQCAWDGARLTASPRR